MSLHPEFINIKHDLTGGSDFAFATASHDFPQFKDRTDRKPLQIVQDVLHSPRIKAAVAVEMKKENWPKEAAEMRAKQIATEMGHHFQLPLARGVAYFLNKVVRNVFDGVYINPAQVEEYKSISREMPVILMPTHKTYMDFLMISYLCLHTGAPIPAIAAGMDFLGMKLVGEILRRCGAFYIRRSFGNDQLYWAVFSEYVRSHLINGDQPLEFFLEGTRSRTGKNLHPKFGLLSAVLEPYFKREVYDVAIIPISISYSKILEEKLYAYELLGYPKPKESTSGLLKARTILNSNFGDVFVNFGHPISARDYFSSRLPPSVSHSLDPPLGGFRLTPEETEAVRVLGHRIVKIHQRGAVTSVWSLASLVLSMMGSERSGASPLALYDELCDRLDALVDLVARMGFRLTFHRGSLRDDLRYYVEIHSNVVSVDWDATPRTLDLLPVESSAVNPSAGGNLSPDLLQRAIPRIILSNYANKCLHLLADQAMIALSFLPSIGLGVQQRKQGSSLGAGPALNESLVFSNFSFMQSLFCREFICVPGEERISFDAALSRLEGAHVLRVQRAPNDSAQRTITPLASRDLSLLCASVQTFLIGYWIVMDVLRATSAVVAEKRVISDAQKRAADLLDSKLVSERYQLLSTDLLKNAVHSLGHRGVLSKLKDPPHSHMYAVDYSALMEKMGRLESFMAEIPPTIGLKAKL